MSLSPSLLFSNCLFVLLVRDADVIGVIVRPRLHLSDHPIFHHLLVWSTSPWSLVFIHRLPPLQDYCSTFPYFYITPSQLSTFNSFFLTSIRLSYGSFMNKGLESRSIVVVEFPRHTSSSRLSDLAVFEVHASVEGTRFAVLHFAISSCFLQDRLSSSSPEI
ncbi:hypothetical protein EI94DRAFT_72713 [Lactarius quietus]|nr:hypothetical protein EI94DRAFT_72713 [Lactarius quietus]